MRRVGGYTLSTRLASGALGDVFLGRPNHAQIAPEIAVKVIRPELMSDLRFARLLMAERPSAEGFQHPSSVDIKQITRVNDDAIVVMELLAGQPFGALVQRVRIDKGTLSHRCIAWIGAQIASVLVKAHRTPWFSGAAAPVVHGALAPRSVFVTYDGQVRLLGLGLGRARNVAPPSSTRLPFLAPEILQGRDLTARADVYGLAVLLYEAFTGRSLFRRSTAEATKAAVQQANVPRLNARNLDVNPDIGDLLAEMMAPRPAARPGDLELVHDALRSAADGTDESFQRSLAALMQAGFREEQEAFQRQLAVANRRPGSQVVSGVGPVARDRSSDPEATEPPTSGPAGATGSNPTDGHPTIEAARNDAASDDGARTSSMPAVPAAVAPAPGTDISVAPATTDVAPSPAIDSQGDSGSGDTLLLGPAELPDFLKAAAPTRALPAPTVPSERPTQWAPIDTELKLRARGAPASTLASSAAAAFGPKGSGSDADSMNPVSADRGGDASSADARGDTEAWVSVDVLPRPRGAIIPPDPGAAPEGPDDRSDAEALVEAAPTTKVEVPSHFPVDRTLAALPDVSATIDVPSPASMTDLPSQAETTDMSSPGGPDPDDEGALAPQVSVPESDWAEDTIAGPIGAGAPAGLPIPAAEAVISEALPAPTLRLEPDLDAAAVARPVGAAGIPNSDPTVPLKAGAFDAGPSRDPSAPAELDEPFGDPNENTSKPESLAPSAPVVTIASGLEQELGAALSVDLVPPLATPSPAAEGSDVTDGPWSLPRPSDGLGRGAELLGEDSDDVTLTSDDRTLREADEVPELPELSDVDVIELADPEPQAGVASADGLRVSLESASSLEALEPRVPRERADRLEPPEANGSPPPAISSVRPQAARPLSGWGAAPLTGTLDELRAAPVIPLTSSHLKAAEQRPVPGESPTVEMPAGASPRLSGTVAADRPGEWTHDLRSVSEGQPTLEEPAPASLQAQFEVTRAKSGVPGRVGRYHIKSALAQVRGMWVLTGWDPNLSRPIRIHLLDPQRGWDPHQGPDQRVARFKMSARRWSSLRHSTLPTLLDGGRDGTLYFLVFESPVGTPLTELQAEPAPMSMTRVRALFLDIVEGLHYLHTRGLVLGHVRAASFIVGQDGARFVDLTHLGEAGEAGAPPRPLLAQAPENLAGAPYDHQSEQFALGALLYQLLVGQRPFEGVDDQALAAAIRHRGVRAPRERAPNVDAGLSRACMRMLATAPDDRYPNLAALMEVLKKPKIPAHDTEPDAPAVVVEPASRSRSVVIIEPALPPETTESVMRLGGVSATAFRTWAEAERRLEGLFPSLLVISSAAGAVTAPERANAEWRTVPPAASRLLGPPLATEGLVERLAALAGRTLGVGPAPSGPPEGWPSRLARQVCLRLGLGHDTATRVAVAMAFRQLQHRLRLSANDISDLVPVEARRLFRFRPQPGLPGPPAAQTLWAVELFFTEMQPATGPGRRPAKVLQMLRGHVGTELDGGVMEALVAQLRELYPELDLPAAPHIVPRVLLAGLSDRPELVEALEREGFDVDTADDGHEVWSLLRAKPYRAAVVAEKLEGRDGLSLLRLTRNHPETRSIVFLLLADDASTDLTDAVERAAPAELMPLTSPLEALRVRIVRLVNDAAGG